MMTATRVETIPPITRAEAHVLAATEYARLVEQLRSLSSDDWAKPTDCPLWDVRAIAGHIVGMMSDFTSFRSLTRRMRAATKAAKKTGEPFIDLVLTPDHDGRVIADVIAEWARRHGQPVLLTLTGPAGGEFVAGDRPGEHTTIDAVEFCRTLSCRAQGRGAFTQEVPF